MSARVEIGILAVIVAVSTVLRFYLLDTIPAGWHHDEALMGIMASEAYRGVSRPIFFPGFLGQEPLYIYLSALAMALMNGDQGIMPLRVVSALVGVVTVVVTYLLGREMFDRRVGIISAALLGVSFWHVMLSREAYRVITQPLLEGLTVYLLFVAIKRRSMWCYAIAGLAFGGVAYTYLGARLFPVVLVLFALWWVLVRGWPTRVVRRGLTVFLVVAGGVVAPLLHYFATHPGSFSARISQVSIFQPGVVNQSPLEALVANMAKLLATFTIYGETLWRYNISGRPIFIGIVALLFYVGLIVCLRRAIGKHPASALVLAWFVVMLFPSALSWDVGGYTFRSMGLVPMLFLLPAIGFVALWDFVLNRVNGSWLPAARRAMPAVAAVILIVEGGTTYRDYFVDWANAFGNAYENMEDTVAVARYLNTAARPGEENILVSSEYCEHPVIAHLAPTVYPFIKWFNGGSAIVLPRDGAPSSLYVFQFSAVPREIERYFPSEAKLEESRFPNGAMKMVAYRLSAADLQQIADKVLNDPSFTRTDENVGDEMRLLGYKFDKRVERGGELTVTLLWRVLRDSASTERVTFAHLLDAEQIMWAQQDTTAFHASQWRTGDLVIGTHVLKVGDRVPSGKYSISVGVYEFETKARMRVKGSSPSRDTIHLGYLKVAGQGPANTAPETEINTSLGQAIELRGFDLPGFETQTSPSSIEVNLHWRARSPVDKDYTVFVQLLDADGRLVGQSDHQPDDGRNPTSYWEAGEEVNDHHRIQLDDGLPPGQYQLIAGMYLLSTGQRLIVEDGTDHIHLTNIDIGR